MKPKLPISIRPAKRADIQEIMDLHEDAFDQEDEARIVEALADDGESLLSLVALNEDGRIVGHIQFFPIEVINHDRPANFAGFGPVSAASELQNRGIGTALIEAGLKTIKDQGIQKVFVLGHPKFYKRFGFSQQETVGFAAAWGGPAFMALRLNSGGPEFGELVYPAAFAEN